MSPMQNILHQNCSSSLKEPYAVDYTAIKVSMLLKMGKIY